jgi:hypothetical protein
MKRIMVVIILVAMATMAGCGFMVDKNQAIRAATNLGFTDVKIEDRAIFFLEWRGCSKSDDAGFTVTGKNSQGQRVTILVCVGWPFKGATVRTK